MDYLLHSRILVGFDNGMVQSWELPKANSPASDAAQPKQSPLASAHCHTRQVAVMSAAFPSPPPDQLGDAESAQFLLSNAVRFVTGSLDHTVLLWYGPTLAPLRTFSFHCPVTAVQLLSGADVDFLVSLGQRVVRVNGTTDALPAVADARPLPPAPSPTPAASRPASRGGSGRGASPQARAQAQPEQRA